MTRVPELPEGSNFHAALRSGKSPREIAKLYEDAGWTVRACGYTEFEVAREVAELVVEATPVIVHGTVADPVVNLSVAVGPLVENGIEYFCECYAEDGSLLIQEDSAETS